MNLTAPKRHAWGSALILLWLTAGTGAAYATNAIVPDDYPTIQQAIDSGVDSVVVKEGTYEEDLVATADLTLLAYEPHVSMGSQFQAPVVGSLSSTAALVAIGIRFTGPVNLSHSIPTGTAYARFEGCRFDATLTAPNWKTFLYARGCMFMVDVSIVPYSCEFVNNTFINASLDVAYEGFARYIGNAFVGPGLFGLRANAQDGGVTISGNTVQGKVDGIVVRYPGGATVVGNSVESCSGDAFKCLIPVGPPAGFIEFYDNQVRNCEGDAFDLDRAAGAFTGNVIDSVGGDGLRWSGAPMYRISGNDMRHIGGRGITSERGALTFSRNTIIDTGSDGVMIEHAGRADSNVVGRAGGKGIWITGGFHALIRWNTVYLCTGDAFALNNSDADTIANNIAYANGGAGFAFTGTGTPLLTCNDWHANTGGAMAGVAPGASDLDVDPLFCNVSEDDVQLSAASPLLNAPGCGLIGALGEGCTVAVSVGPGPDSDALALRIFPQPTRDRVTFAWTRGVGAAELEVFDVTGARRWQASAPAGTRSLTWDLGNGRGVRLDPGVYWARLAVDGQVRVSRLVLIR